MPVIASAFAYDDDDDDDDADDDDDDDDNGHDINTNRKLPRRGSRIRTKTKRYEPSMKGQVYETMHVQTTQGLIQCDQETAIVATKIINRLNEMSFVESYSLKAGIKRFGKKGEDAAIGEMKQLHDRKCFKPIRPQELTKEERRKVLETIIFIVEKRDGRIKARSCADGRKQRDWMTREDTASPTVATESVMMTAAIDAKEKRDVVTMDIPNAFIQTDYEGEVLHMKVRGQLAELLKSIDPELYAPYIVYENGQAVLYLQVLKAIYGTLQAALLYYRKWRKDLESIGYTINKYDPCVANKTINGNQHTIRWHVDDVMASHVDPKVNDHFIEWVKTKYEDKDIGEVKVTRGKEHDYLAMDFDYNTEGVVKIKMVSYIEKMIDEFKYKEEVLEGIAKTPAAGHLFVVNDNATKLYKEKADEFHTTVAKALFVCMRARPDITLAVAFLCTRVKEPDEDDWKKLLRLLKYLKGTKQLYLTLEVDNTGIITWYVDAAFAVHHNMRSHTGGTMTMGKGSVISKSIKQKLNTKSSTEAELVGADDISGQLLLTRYFLQDHGYDMKSVLMQDNKSSILLLENGRESSSKRTRHLNIRYYFLTDRIKKNELKVQYCSTDDMLADFFTKPLQGMKFRKMRNKILNMNHDEKK